MGFEHQRGGASSFKAKRLNHSATEAPPIRENEKSKVNEEPLQITILISLETVLNDIGNLIQNSETFVGRNSKAIYMLSANTRHFAFKPKTMSQLFDVCVNSYLTYAFWV